MFFIGIFGIASKEEIVKEIRDIPCRKCSGSTYGNLIKVYRVFQFFFIPIFKWGERYFIKCSSCGSIYELTKEKGIEIEEDEEYNLTYWDLHEIENQQGYSSGNICSSCGRSVDEDFIYCPYCGHKMK